MYLYLWQFGWNPEYWSDDEITITCPLEWLGVQKISREFSERTEENKR